ncbi:hypothetical protein TWF481_010408 [Arthrobotrys musiformis]|uniref:Uncharacterized protein n=1 Tax=Arthrobotrys musiformis TaxID=47236 RepID=A0AAV9W0R1_9PEZI
MQGHLLQLDPKDIEIEFEESRFNTWSELSSSPKAKCDAATYFQCAYLQIWLYTLRHFPYISSVSPRKEKGQCKAEVKETNPVVMYKLAELFKRFNILTEEVEQKLRSRPIEEYVRRLLIDCSVECLDPESRAFNDLVKKVSQHLRTKMESLPKIDIDHEEQEESPVRRTGRPFMDSFKRYRAKLYLPEILSHFLGSVTAIEARKTFIRRFWDVDILFGVLEEPRNREGSRAERDSIMDGVGSSSESWYRGNSGQAFQTEPPDEGQQDEGQQDEETGHDSVNGARERVSQRSASARGDERIDQQQEHEGGLENTAPEPVLNSSVPPATADPEVRLARSKGKRVVRSPSPQGTGDSPTSSASDADSLGRHKRRKSNRGGTISYGTRLARRVPRLLQNGTAAQIEPGVENVGRRAQERPLRSTRIELIQHENGTRRKIAPIALITEFQDIQARASSQDGNIKLCMYTANGQVLPKPGTGADEFWLQTICRERRIFIGQNPPPANYR